jgi:DNA-binding IclR family transcriptional regulator
MYKLTKAEIDVLHSVLCSLDPNYSDMVALESIYEYSNKAPATINRYVSILENKGYMKYVSDLKCYQLTFVK